ncbi:uncharacterized protein LOC121855614 isoform X2 [Homarus americanus]|uniref:uncharacterized protein LOC121855614 isoform X2 n=1 Tax=Homarus americanus TaxID=6706 RepID=UPI001C4854DA|nr:uncharacterized protein LOC121855614 isoform X2 [Homarus americanus]
MHGSFPEHLQPVEDGDITVLTHKGNVVAVWCVVTCNKIHPPVKLVLSSVFVTTFLMCLVVMPFAAQVSLSKLLCEPSRIPLAVSMSFGLLYTTLAEMELFYISAVAFLRAVAVWSPHRRSIGMKMAVGIVVSVFLYSITTTLGLLGPIWMRFVKEKSTAGMVVGLVYTFLHTLLPVLLTMACYCSMMLAVCRNKRRLAAHSQHSTNSVRVIDEATRAMMAVFVTNLLLALPHSVFHLFYDLPFTTYVIIHVLFFSHFLVDPMVFIWFNGGHRQRVWGKVLVGLERVRCWYSSSTAASISTSTSTLATVGTPASSTDDAKNHNQIHARSQPV